MAAMIRATFMCLAVSAMLMKLAMAATYTVGGSNGWDTSTDLATWVSAQKFVTGDSLVFQYSPNHDVSEVSKSDYDNCVASNALQVSTGGNTQITLSSPGKRYFICGTAGHCSQGMKLEVDTLAATAPPTAPPTAPTASPVTPVSAPPPEVSTPAPTGSSPSAPTMSPPMPSTEAPIPSVETPANAPIPSGLAPVPPPPSAANKSSFTVAFGFAMMMLFAL